MNAEKLIINVPRLELHVYTHHSDDSLKMAPHMPTDPNNAKNTFLYNYEWWADYRDDIDAKFQAWLAQ